MVMKFYPFIAKAIGALYQLRAFFFSMTALIKASYSFDVTDFFKRLFQILF